MIVDNQASNFPLLFQSSIFHLLVAHYPLDEATHNQ